MKKWLVLCVLMGACAVDRNEVTVAVEQAKIRQEHQERVEERVYEVTLSDGTLCVVLVDQWRGYGEGVLTCNWQSNE